MELCELCGYTLTTKNTKDCTKNTMNAQSSQKFISDRLIQKINEFNQKRKSSITNQRQKV